MFARVLPVSENALETVLSIRSADTEYPAEYPVRDALFRATGALPSAPTWWKGMRHLDAGVCTSRGLNSPLGLILRDSPGTGTCVDGRCSAWEDVRLYVYYE